MNFYVANGGSDENPGTLDCPFGTIQKAADLMQPGDTCLIRAGVYREWIKPRRGGLSETQRITYRAFPGETPDIKGSERIVCWQRVRGDVWKTDLPNTFFGSYNPYILGITGEWLEWTSGLHRGDVYLNGVPYAERPDPVALDDSPGTWAVVSDRSITTIWANFGGADPTVEEVEINVRELVFFPEVPGLSFITVSGLSLMHAANNWAPPESFQRGLIGVNWGAHWIIEDCMVSDAKCVGISGGKYDPATLPSSLDIRSVGHHIVRHNWIRRCGEAGIAGNYGFCASLIEGNLIEDINYKVEFGGEETAGIKVHHAVDVVVKGNLIRRVFDGRGKGGGDYPGIWIDWCNQGARITGNVVYDTDHYCLFLEACHGPLLVDNNLFVGKVIRMHAKRVVLAHNLFCDSGIFYQDWTADHRTPAWFVPHSWKAAGSGRMRIEGNRFFNNVFIRSTLENVNDPVHCESGGNLFYSCPPDMPSHIDGAVDTTFGAQVRLRDLAHGVEITLHVNETVSRVATEPVTHARIGVFDVVKQGIEDHQGRPVDLITDMFNMPRDASHPTVGSVETLDVPDTRTVFAAGRETG